MRTLLGRKILALSAGALVALATAAGPASAESRASITLASRRVHQSRRHVNRHVRRNHHVRRNNHVRRNRHNRYHHTYRQWGHHQRHHTHVSACYSLWVPAGYEIVTERVWMTATYEDIVTPWEVKWTWHAAHGFDAHPVTITNDPNSSPPRPNVHQFGTGNWEKRILQQRRVHKQWVPAHWDTVERKVHRPGRYTLACGY